MSQLYFWGKTICPSFQTESQTDQPAISSVKSEKKIKNIACGSQHSIFLTQENQLFAFGSNEYGQMGLALNSHKFLEISRIFVPTKKLIVSISCGWYHTLILDQLGNVFSTGKGTQGGNGQGNKQHSYGFKHVISEARYISAGRDHSLCIKRNKVFGWGNTEQGQLGLHSKRVFTSPKELNIYPCDQVYAGAKYSIFVTIKGVYGCGLNNNYQLGLGSNKNLHYPKKLEIPDQKKILKIWCGNYCFAQDIQGFFSVWGTGAFGVFKYPTKLDFFSGCEKFQIGQNFGLMEKNGQIFVWGSNHFGQLALQTQQLSRDYAFRSQNLSSLNLSSLHCGNDFVIGLSEWSSEQQTNKVIPYQYSLKDSIRQNSGSSSRYSIKPKINAYKTLYSSQNSFYKSTQSPTRHEISFVSEEKYDNNNAFTVCNPSNQHGRLPNVKKQGCSSPLNKSTHSHSTIKRTVSTNQPGMNIEDVERLYAELEDLKNAVHERDEANCNLKIRNQELRDILKQELLREIKKQKTEEARQQKIEQGQSMQITDFQENQQQNNQLRNLQGEHQKLYQLREQHSLMRSIIDKNVFLRNLLGMQDEWSKTLEKWDHDSAQIDQFGHQLGRLQTVLKEAASRKKEEENE